MLFIFSPFSKALIGLLSYVLLLFSSLSVAAQEAKSPIQPINTGTSWEEWHDPIPVSGEIRVGVMAGPNQDISSAQNSFFVKAPANFSYTSLCVSISSIDGRYSANMPFDASKLTLGTICELAWESDYVADLAKIKDEKLVILVGVGENCQDRPKAFLIAAWQESHLAKLEDIFFYANSTSNPKLQLNYTGGSKEKIEFNEIFHDKSVSYKIKSKIDYATIQTVESINLSQKVRRGAGYSFKSYPFNVLL